MSLYRKWLVHRYGSSYRHTGAAKRNIALTVICAVIVLLYSILIVVMACVQNPTEKNTALFSATVADADYSILSSSALEIRTEEHPFCAFMVRPPVSELVQAGDAPRLQPGDNITFRVRNAEAPFLQGGRTKGRGRTDFQGGGRFPENGNPDALHPFRLQPDQPGNLDAACYSRWGADRAERSRPGVFPPPQEAVEIRRPLL